MDMIRDEYIRGTASICNMFGENAWVAPTKSIHSAALLFTTERLKNSVT